MIITGLIFNLIGSLFLAYHIIGANQAKKFEQKILNLPHFIAYDFIGWLFYVVFITGFIKKLKICNLEEINTKGRKDRDKEIENILKKGEEYYERRDFYISKDRNKFPENLIYTFSYIVWISISILLFPLIGFVSVTIKLFSKIQNTFKIESLLGVIGIILLLIGFALQLIGNL